MAGNILCNVNTYAFLDIITIGYVNIHLLDRKNK